MKKSRLFSAELIITVAALIIELAVYSAFLKYIESRPGTVIDDPVLALFAPVDLSAPVFILLYLSVFGAIVYFSFDMKKLIQAVQSYILLVIFRMMAMYTLPLDPPEQLIPLIDPLVELMGPGTTLTRDLFFSGHTSTVFIIAFNIDKTWVKAVFFAIGVIVAVMVVLQHVHYTVDVLAAPFFAYGAYRLSVLLRRKFLFPVKNKRVK
ncbi:MAG: phosphatase PAP2-related protein [Candidatus Kapaibacterium sp.]